MKKIIIVLGILVIIFFAVIVTLPMFFKTQITDLVKDQANKQIDATLDFEEVDLSLIKNFPELTMTISDLLIINEEPFAGDTLVNLKEFQATINLGSLVFSDQVEIASIQLVEPRLYIRTLEDGRANWDIVPIDTLTAEIDTAAAAYNLAIQKYSIADCYLTYIDEAASITAQIDKLNHSGTGDFNQTLFTLTTQTDISAVTVSMEGIPYLNKAELAVKADLGMDMDKMEFSFKENEINLNRLALNFDGRVALADDEDIRMDISFKAPRADFKDILSMIPYIYKQEFAELTAEGQVTVAGEVEGVYNDETVPRFDIRISVNNGMFKYPDLPTPVEQVAINLRIKNPGRTLDETIVEMKKFHLEVLNEPVDMTLRVTTPISDPFINAHFQGNIDLSEVQNFVPLGDSIELAGMIRSNFRFEGNMSAIEADRPDRVAASGAVSVSDIVYTAPDLPVKIQIKSAELDVSPQKAMLKNLRLLMGESDISAGGKLENMLGFVLSDQTLKGNLDIQSNKFDLNPWLVEESEDTLYLEAIELPDKIEFVMAVDFKHVIYENLNLTNTRGKLILKDRILKLVGLKSNLLLGSMIADGSYDYIPPQKPKFDFDLELADLNIPEMFKAFNTVQKAAPLARHLQGDLSGKLNISSELGDSLMPDLQSLTSRGSLHIPKARVENLEALNKLADAVKIKELHNPTLVDFKPSYTIENGRFYLNENTFKLADYKVTASGSNGFDKSLDYLVAIDVPTAKMGELIGQDLSLLGEKTFVVPATVKGTTDNPRIGLDLKSARSQIGSQLKQTAKDEADKKKKELEQKAKDELAARKKAEEDKLKAEIEKKKKDAEKELKDKVKGLFGR
ncbi:MAG: AsmA family protein [candidate division Zixibacteria bacterium]|nr:AsmA family protein [candidate division Zixibacteria bacterium]